MTLEDLNEDKRHSDKLIAEYRELADVWNGKCLQTESKMQDIAGELEDYGINVEDLD